MKKNVIFVTISLIVLFSLGIALSYSMWNMSLSQETNNVIATTSECFDVTLTNESNAIKLENAYPISDTKGKNLTPFTFTIKNVCNTAASYSVSLESLKDSTLSSGFLKVMVNDNDPKILNSLDTTDTVNSGSIESRVLDTGIIFKNQTKDYSIRLWIDYDTTLEDLDNEIKTLKSKIIIKATSLGYTGESIFDFDYTGGEQTFTVPVSGTYKLETWGAQGGTSNLTVGGYGGYSNGQINLNKDEKIFINVGGTTTDIYGGYNGGGNGSNGTLGKIDLYLGGGGATHIATKSGILSSLENYKSNILIVSGGGGGTYHFNDDYIANGGSGGGFTGNSGSIFLSECGAGFTDTAATGGTQTSGGLGNNSSSDYSGSFGQGGSGGKDNMGTGAGGGYYGGGGTYNVGCSSEGSGGGSGYISNSLLKYKTMYCYNCQESSEENTKTISTTCSEETPTENCAKKGNGYARITLISIDE